MSAVGPERPQSVPPGPQARHATYGIRKCFLFLLQCQLTLVVIQVRWRQHRHRPLPTCGFAQGAVESQRWEAGRMQYSQGAPQSFFENPWAFGDDPVGTIVSPSGPSSSRPGQEHRCGHRARQNLTVLSGPFWSSSSLAWSSCRHCSVPLTSCGCPAFATLCSGEKLAVPPCPGRQGWDVASCPRSPGSGSPAHCLPLPAQGPREGLPLVLSLLPASPALASKTPQRLPTWELGDGGSQSPRLT